MEHQWKFACKAIAEVTGKDLIDVKKQLNQTPRRNMPLQSPKFAVISESFPSMPSLAGVKRITRDE